MADMDTWARVYKEQFDTIAGSGWHNISGAASGHVACRPRNIILGSLELSIFRFFHDNMLPQLKIQCQASLKEAVVPYDT